MKRTPEIEATIDELVKHGPGENGSVVQVPLHGKGGGIALIDAADADLVLKFKWYAVRSNHRLYVRSPLGRPHKGSIRLHRLIMGAKAGEIVDHANGDTFDNRRVNLRIASPAESAANAKHKTGASGFRGVVKTRRGKGFQSRCRFNRANHYGPSRATAQEAARDYDAMALRIHGAFAILNFPDSPSPDAVPQTTAPSPEPAIPLAPAHFSAARDWEAADVDDGDGSDSGAVSVATSARGTRDAGVGSVSRADAVLPAETTGRVGETSAAEM